MAAAQFTADGRGGMLGLSAGGIGGMGGMLSPQQALSLNQNQQAMMMAGAYIRSNFSST